VLPLNPAPEANPEEAPLKTLISKTDKSSFGLLKIL
jgi:hypothetical protein